MRIQTARSRRREMAGYAFIVSFHSHQSHTRTRTWVRSDRTGSVLWVMSFWPQTSCNLARLLQQYLIDLFCCFLFLHFMNAHKNTFFPPKKAERRLSYGQVFLFGLLILVIVAILADLMYELYYSSEEEGGEDDISGDLWSFYTRSSINWRCRCF